jgi:hypothetical protein
MPTLNLVAGDYDIDSSGHHVCDESGFAILLTETKEVTITEQTDYDRINPILEDQRVRRGLNPDGSEIEELVEGENT